MGLRETSDKVEGKVLPNRRGNWKRLKETGRFFGLVFLLLTDEALGYITVDIIHHSSPEEILLEPLQGFCNSHVAAQRGGMEFPKQYGSEGAV